MGHETNAELGYDNIGTESMLGLLSDSVKEEEGRCTSRMELYY